MTAQIWTRDYLRQQLETALLNPIRAFRLEYLPLLMVYFAYGALGITAIAETFWVKQKLALSAEDLAALGVWLTLPWTIKMVFGELVDTVAIFGSQRRAYVFLGGGLVAVGLLLLAGAAGGQITSWKPETLYRIASFLITVGVVLQDVVADTMTTEIVPRLEADGRPRPKEDIDRDLGMVQVLGRLALSLGSFMVAGIAGVLASVYSYSTVFLLALVIPVISVSGAALVRIDRIELRPIDWNILGGGIVYGIAVVMLAATGWRYNQEIIFVMSMAVVIAMLRRVTGELDAATKRRIFFAALVIFVFRAMPGVGPGYTWFAIDKLGFDETFQGTLGQIGTGLALLGTWLLSDTITKKPVTSVLMWLTIISALLALPGIGLTLGLHQWTEQHLGFGAHAIAIIDTAAASPFVQLSIIPLLTLCAIYAPAGHRASWFALMASLMNLALVAGQLATKYLNSVIVVARGDYHNLPLLLILVTVIGLAVPVVTIMLAGRQVR